MHLQRKISNIINIFHTIDNIYFLEGKNIFRFKYKQNWNHKGLFKLPTEKVLEISNLYDTFSEEQLSKSFLFSKIDKVFVIINFFDIGLIQDSIIIRILKASNEIISINYNILEGINKIYKIRKVKRLDNTQTSDYKPSNKTLLVLSKFSEITEVVDLFYLKSISINIEKKLSNDWHLDPLDRGFLSSEYFYQEKLYDYLKGYLNLTVQGLFLSNPDVLLMLQEALREQETQIYADGHLQPDKTIASLIASSLPLPSSYDTSFQSNIRSMFLNSLK